jgi:dipeptidyl aminopeptidase/acylaminoacyl peptidase
MRIFLVFCLTLAATLTFAKQPTPTELLSPPLYEDVAISPTGSYLAVTKNEDGASWFGIYKMPDRKLTFGSTLGEKIKIQSMKWIHDDYLLVTPARRFGSVLYPTGELMTVNASKGKIKKLSQDDCRMCRYTVIDELPQNPEYMLVAGAQNQFNDAYLVNIINGVFRKLDRGAGPRGTFVANPAGEIVFSTGVTADFKTEVYRKRGSDWDLLETIGQGQEGWVPWASGPRKDTYLTWDTRGGGTRGLDLYDLSTDTHKMLYRFGEVDLGRVYRDLNHQVYAVRSDINYPAIHYLSSKHPLTAVHQNLQKNYPDDTVTITSATRDNSKVIALVNGDRNPGQFLLVDLKAKNVEVLFSAKPELTADMLATMSPIELKARDGTKLSGYVTSATTTPKPGPMVVVVHGGPFGQRDTWGFNADVQLLASQGVHVLQLNFRGSSGYGLKFESAGHTEWGGLMQDDVTDGTAWAVQTGLADPQRICIYGSGYGAYAALMGTAREPDLYRCAVGVSGIYDLSLLESSGDARQGQATKAFLTQAIGDDKEKLNTRSPVNHANQIKAKVMLVHSGGDRLVPIVHAERMRDALKSANNEPGWLSDGSQGEGFSGLPAQLQLADAVNRFMAPLLGLAPLPQTGANNNTVGADR